MARREQHRRLRTNYMVLGDGQTEQFYLKHLKTLFGYKYKVFPSLFSDITIECIEDKIDELLSGGCNLIVYFTDYDIIVKQDKQTKFRELVYKYRNFNEVLICETMPCIEFWFLLHYKKTTREFLDAEDVRRELEKFINSYSKSKSFLCSTKWVKDLSSDGRIKTATKYAEEIMTQKENQEVGKHFPFTRVHKGIERFEQIHKIVI